MSRGVFLYNCYRNLYSKKYNFPIGLYIFAIVSSSTIFKGKGYIQLETEDDIDKVYEPGVYAIKGTSYNDQTLLVFSHNLGQSTVQFRTNNYGGFLVFRIKWWNGAWGTWKTVSLT